MLEYLNAEKRREVLGVLFDMDGVVIDTEKLYTRFWMEAAEDLGCSPMQRLRRVVLPLSMPGVISGIIMVFIPSVSTFYISSKMGGTENSMIGDLIERQIRVQNDLSVASAISLLLMVVILVSMFVLNRFSDDNEGGSMLV